MDNSKPLALARERRKRRNKAKGAPSNPGHMTATSPPQPTEFQQLKARPQAQHASALPEIWTIREVAGYMKRSQYQVREWVKKRHLPCVRFQGMIWIRVQDLADFIEQHLEVKP